jgi:hypothetical protein
MKAVRLLRGFKTIKDMVQDPRTTPTTYQQLQGKPEIIIITTAFRFKVKIELC